MKPPTLHIARRSWLPGLGNALLLGACGFVLLTQLHLMPPPLVNQSSRACPSDCSGNGQCLKGHCFCRTPYGGEDCSQHSLDLMGLEWAATTNFSLGLGDRCSFLVGDEVMVRDDGFGNGTGEVFYGSRGNNMYHVPESLMEAIPATCPDLRWKRCAIVGNSGSLAYDSFGAEIDSHDMIFRFNQAPLAGYEAHVGRRTTIESLNTRFARRLVAATRPPAETALNATRLSGHGEQQGEADAKEEKVEERPRWLWRRPPATFLLFEPNRMKDVYPVLRKQMPAIKILMLGPHFVHAAVQLHERLRRRLRDLGLGCMSGEKPMSGFFAVVMAMRSCQQVDLYGFDPWNDAMAGRYARRYHYWDAEEPREGAHSYELTFYTYALLELSKEHSVRIRRVQVPEGAAYGGMNERSQQQESSPLRPEQGSGTTGQEGQAGMPRGSL